MHVNSTVPYYTLDKSALISVVPETNPQSQNHSCSCIFAKLHLQPRHLVCQLPRPPQRKASL